MPFEQLCHCPSVSRKAKAMCRTRTESFLARRLNTIMNCDKILVMSEGKVAESAPPAELLLDKVRYFFW